MLEDNIKAAIESARSEEVRKSLLTKLTTIKWIREKIAPINIQNSIKNCTLVAEKCLKVLAGLEAPDPINNTKRNIDIEFRTNDDGDIIYLDVLRKEQLNILPPQEYKEISDLISDKTIIDFTSENKRDRIHYQISTLDTLSYDISLLPGSMASNGHDKTMVGFVYGFYKNTPGAHLFNFMRDSVGNIFFVDAQSRDITEILPHFIYDNELRDKIYFFSLPPESGYFIKREIIDPSSIKIESGAAFQTSEVMPNQPDQNNLKRKMSERIPCITAILEEIVYIDFNNNKSKASKKLKISAAVISNRLKNKFDNEISRQSQWILLSYLDQQDQNSKWSRNPDLKKYIGELRELLGGEREPKKQCPMPISNPVSTNNNFSAVKGEKNLAISFLLKKVVNEDFGRYIGKASKVLGISQDVIFCRLSLNDSSELALSDQKKLLEYFDKQDNTSKLAMSPEAKKCITELRKLTGWEAHSRFTSNLDIGNHDLALKSEDRRISAISFLLAKIVGDEFGRYIGKAVKAFGIPQNVLSSRLSLNNTFELSLNNQKKLLEYCDKLSNGSKCFLDPRFKICIKKLRNHVVIKEAELIQAYGINTIESEAIKPHSEIKKDAGNTHHNSFFKDSKVLPEKKENNLQTLGVHEISSI